MRNWAIPIVLSGLALIGAAPTSGSDQERGRLQGEWQITSAIDDGMLLPDKHIKMHLVKDGRIVIQGAMFSFINPENDTKQEAAYVLTTDTYPKSIDMVGRGRTRSRGIYLIDGDVLLVCLAGPEARTRPTEFAAPEGSNNLLLTLKRVRNAARTATTTITTTSTTAPTTTIGGTPTPPVVVNSPRIPAPPMPPFPPAPPVVDPMVQMRKQLIGTWGHQNDQDVFLATFNTDGSFSTTRTPKKGFRKIFREPTRSSGSWKLENGVIIVRVTASIERDLQGQIMSYRIRSLSDTQAVLIDSTGRMHVEWKTP